MVRRRITDHVVLASLYCSSMVLEEAVQIGHYRFPHSKKDFAQNLAAANLHHGSTEAPVKSDESESGPGTASRASTVLHGAHRRTLEALFRHPTAHNLDWMDVITLFENIGAVHRKANEKFALELAGEHYLVHKPNTKVLTSSEVVDLRHFLQRAGWSAAGPGPTASRRDPEPATLMVVVDHHGAKIYRIELGSDDSPPHAITPYDPHHFLHRLTHKDQLREEGQRAREDSSFYRRIGDTLAGAGRILVAGHGKGKSNAAQHLLEYLRTHHRETYQRIVRDIEVDLSAITTPQLLELAKQTFGLRP
jgi:hypothetical protein